MDVILLENVATFKYRGANLKLKEVLSDKELRIRIAIETPTMVIIGIIWNNKNITFRIKKYL